MKTRVAGFSLVELMVTMAVIAVLALAAMPFARSWIDGNRQMQARNLMWEAVSQTRAVALRNPENVANGAVSARLIRDGRGLSVLRGTGEELSWSGQLPNDIDIKLASNNDFDDADALQASGDDLACVAFGSRGQRLPGANNCTSGATLHRLAIGMNSQDPLYVDLL